MIVKNKRNSLKTNFNLFSKINFHDGQSSFCRNDFYEISSLLRVMYDSRVLESLPFQLRSMCNTPVFDNAKATGLGNLRAR